MDINRFENEIKKIKVKTVLIQQEDKLLFEYYKNKKQKGLQRMNSITKSVISILYGVLLKEGFLSSLDIPIIKFFPFLKEEEQRKQEITIYHLLTMTDGLDFPEFGEWNFFSPMNYQPDMIKFVLKRPLQFNPGEHMNYNSGASHLLSSILQQVTHKTCEEFANEYLFQPLGIVENFWYKRNNINMGADGLLLKTDGLLKVGQLMLNEGNWNGKEIITSAWVHKITDPLYITYDEIGYYGMHWWVDKERDYYFALGYGGQFLIVVPSKKLIITITSEIYKNSLLPLHLVNEYLL